MASGASMRPRLNVHVRLSRLCMSHASSVTPASSSSGFRMSWSLTKRIDSRLDMFFVKGHHGIVTASPTIVRNTSRYTPTVGRRHAATHASVSTRKAIGNGSGARV